MRAYSMSIKKSGFALVLIAVMAETAAGYERLAEGGPTDISHGVQGKQSLDADDPRAQAARDRVERLRLTGRIEDKNMADDLEARAYNTELLVDRIEQTDTFGAIAVRNLTVGLSDKSKMRQITELKEGDLVLSEQDQRDLGRVSPIGYERRFEWGKDLAAPLLGGLILTFLLMMLYRYWITSVFKQLAWNESTIAAFAATVLTCTLIGGYGFADSGSPAFGRAFFIYIIPSIIGVAYFLLRGEPPKARSPQ